MQGTSGFTDLHYGERKDKDYGKLEEKNGKHVNFDANSTFTVRELTYGQ